RWNRTAPPYSQRAIRPGASPSQEPNCPCNLECGSRRIVLTAPQALLRLSHIFAPEPPSGHRRRRPRKRMELSFQTGTLLLLIAAVVAMLTRRLRLPYSVGLVTAGIRSEEHTSELPSLTNIVCRLLL